MPIHAWLHPWLPFLGSALEELYPVIRHKLGVALQVRGQPWRARAAPGQRPSVNACLAPSMSAWACAWGCAWARAWGCALASVHRHLSTHLQGPLVRPCLSTCMVYGMGSCLGLYACTEACTHAHTCAHAQECTHAQTHTHVCTCALALAGMAPQRQQRPGPAPPVASRI